MNKKIIRILFVFFAIIFSNSICYAGDSIKDFGFAKSIEIMGNQKYKSIFLDNDIYRNSKDNLDDIRIVDNKDKFVPFYIDSGYIEYTNKIIEYSTNRILKYQKDNYTYFDFEVNKLEYNTDILANRLIVSLDASEYLKDIVIYASFDGKKWDHLKSDRIYNIRNVQNNIVNLGEVKRYGFYRIGIAENIENFEVSSLRLENDYAQINQNNYIRNSKLKYQINTDGKVTYINISNPDKLKIKQINLSIDGVFKRDYEILSNVDSSLVYSGKSGELYNLDFKNLSVNNTSITLNNLLNGDIQIKIFNNDDQPLNIKDLNVVNFVDKIVFEANGDKEYRIVFGNPNANKPRYDIEEYKNNIEEESQDESKLGALQTFENTTQKVQKDYTFIFNIVMILVSILLVVFIGMKLKAKAE